MTDHSLAPSVTPKARNPIPANTFYFCLTLDTEPDDLWSAGSRVTFDHFAHLYEFHKAVTDRGARPTYLTTSEVAESHESARVMDRILSSGKAELGAHFHSWTRNWPFELPPLGTPPLHAMAHRLGQPLEEKMLQYTCSSLEKAFSIRPQSYRGGRWSLNQESIRSLVNCGIRVDTTVTPGRTWEDARHPLLSGPDFREHARCPYFYSVDSANVLHDTGDVLELPVGASFINRGRTVLRRDLIGKLARGTYTIADLPFGWLWLRPTHMTERQLRACLSGLRQDGVPVWVAMIHSSEIVRCSPLPKQALVDQFIERCLKLVDHAVELGAQCATLEEVRAIYE